MKPPLVVYRAQAGVSGRNLPVVRLFVVIMTAACALLLVPHVHGAQLSAAELIAGLGDRDLEVRQDCEARLAKMGPEVLPKLLTALNEGRRREAIIRIFNRKGCDAVPGLIRLLSDEEARPKAGSMLFQAANPDCVKYIGPYLACMGDPKAGNYCGAALVKTSSPKARSRLPELRKSLAGGSAESRSYVIAAIGEIGKKASPAVPELLAALKDPAQLVRLAAAAALGKIGGRDQAARDALGAAAAGDADGEVRREAAESLKAFK